MHVRRPALLIFQGAVRRTTLRSFLFFFFTYPQGISRRRLPYFPQVPPLLRSVFFLALQVFVEVCLTRAFSYRSASKAGSCAPQYFWCPPSSPPPAKCCTWTGWRLELNAAREMSDEPECDAQRLARLESRAGGRCGSSGLMKARGEEHLNVASLFVVFGVGSH